MFVRQVHIRKTSFGEVHEQRKRLDDNCWTVRNKSSFKMLRVLLITLALTIPMIDALCCSWFLNKNVKCECGDGSLVAPWQCCSEGQCNIFCCNCDGPCKGSNSSSNDLEEFDRVRAKREVLEEAVSRVRR